MSGASSGWRFDFSIAGIGCVVIGNRALRSEKQMPPSRGRFPVGAHSKLIRTISGLVPTRIGGPQVPAPQEV
jgi:hypothetical protein